MCNSLVFTIPGGSGRNTTPTYYGFYQPASSTDGVIGIMVQRLPADAFQAGQGQLHQMAQIEIQQGALPEGFIDFY